MGERITVVLPVDAPDPGAAVASGLAPRLDTLDGRLVGVVDNGLWRSMATVVECIDRAVRQQGGRGLERTPFDHLAADFDSQQRGLWPFGERVAGAVAGLGN
jgi:hypothetical protein